MSMNPFTVSQDTLCLLMSSCSSSGAGAVVPAGIFTPVLQPIPLSCPRGWFLLAGPCPGCLQLRPARARATGVAANHIIKLLQICAKFISPSRPGDTFYPELLLSTCCSFLNCSGLMSSMLVSARGVISVEILNKIPSAYFKWESGKIDFYNC